jgi:hypothetical protein
MSNGDNTLENAAASLTEDAIKALATFLTGARSVICEISNNTELTLTKTGDNLDHGGFAVSPDVVIPPHTASGFGAQSVGGSIATGTEGRVFYSAPGIDFTAHWDNPFIGSNSSDASVGGPHAQAFVAFTETGVGNTDAHMRYFLFSKFVAAQGRRESWQLLQSDFGTPDHNGNFEVVVLEGNNLVHYFHDNSNPGGAWQRGLVISTQATGPGSIIQSDFGTPLHHGNFEVVVLEGNNLVHYFHDNSNPSGPWQRGLVISNQATGPGQIIQSDFRSGTNGNFEVVVLEGSNLVHYFHDSSNPGGLWQRGQVISTKATGPGSILQSDFRPGPNGNFEVVVPEGNQLVHYFHDNSDLGGRWQQGQVIDARGIGPIGPGSIIQSDFRSGANGNFEVVVLEGNNLVHFFHDNSNPGGLWQRGQVISTQATGLSSIIQSDFCQRRRKTKPHGGGIVGQFGVVFSDGRDRVSALARALTG